MKKSYIVGIILVILIVLGLIIGGVFGKSEPVGPADTNNNNNNNNNVTNTPVTLTSIHSDVFAKTADNQAGAMVTAPVTLTQNDGVKTTATGRALLEDSDFKTTIDHDTEISIKEIKEKQVKLALNSGSVWLRVQKVFGVGEGVEVETSNAVAAVRGTSFGLSFFQGITTLFVTEGTVGFRAIGSSTAEETLVHAGQKAVLGKDGKIVVTSLTDKDKSDEWFKFNNTTTSTTISAPPSSPTPAPPPTTNPPTPPTPTTTPQIFIDINSVSPAIVTSQPAPMVVYGDGFDIATKLFVGQKQFQFEKVSDTRIKFVLDKMSEGIYDLKISGQGSSDTKSQAITIRGSQNQSNSGQLP